MFSCSGANAGKIIFRTDAPMCKVEQRDEVAVGWFIMQAADLVPGPAADVGLDKPLPLCGAPARMYRGRKVNPADLDIKLVGGPQQVDEVVVAILDETGQNPWARGLPNGVSEEEAKLFVWGPWQFNTGASL